MVRYSLLILEILEVLSGSTILVASSYLTVHHNSKYITIIIYSIFGFFYLARHAWLNFKARSDIEASDGRLFWSVFKSLFFFIILMIAMRWCKRDSYNSNFNKAVAELPVIFTILEGSFCLLHSICAHKESKSSEDSRNSRRNEISGQNLENNSNIFIPTIESNRDGSALDYTSPPPPYIAFLPALPTLPTVSRVEKAV